MHFYNARWYDSSLGRFNQPDSIIPEQSQGVQAWDRYAYANNNPLKYTDPSGHRPDDGCRTEGCSLTQFQKNQDAQKLALLERESHQRKCEAGNDAYCSTATEHPAEVAGFVITGLVGGPLVENFVLGGGLAGATDWALWRAGLSCISNAVCRTVTGMAGGAGTVSQTDYYVTSNGQAIPSTGYRYGAGSGFNNAITNGTLPARADGTYFTFEYYVEKTVAKSSLQMPYLPEKGVSFNTLQIIDDIYVPNGMYGASSILEPIAVDFPKFGAGGATQVVTYSPIQINSWWWLK